MSVGLSVCLSVGPSVCRSVRNEFYGSVMLFLVYKCCYCCYSLRYLNILSCDSSSISRNVSRSVRLFATSFMEVLCCYKCIIVVTVVVVYDIRTICCHKFSAIAAL